MNWLIIEDNAFAKEMLEEFLFELYPNLGFIRGGDNITTGLKLIKTHHLNCFF